LIKLINDEVSEFSDKDTKKVFIGGTSQGCMVSLATFLRWSGTQRLGGVIGMVGLQGLKITDEEEKPEKMAV